jgi:hypothetical protein
MQHHIFSLKTRVLQSRLHHAVDESSHLGTNCFLGKKNLDVNPNWNQHVRKEEEENLSFSTKEARLGGT